MLSTQVSTTRNQETEIKDMSLTENLYETNRNRENVLIMPQETGRKRENDLIMQQETDKIREHGLIIQQETDRKREYDLIMQQETDKIREHALIIQQETDRERENVLIKQQESNSNVEKTYQCPESLKDEKKLSKVQKFYDGKNILITGGTGFFGKVLMEKLLRSCPGVENIYVLVRQKRGKDEYTRIQEIFNDPVFDRLKKEIPNFYHKVVVISGDCGMAGLGLCLNDQEILIEKVNVVFHSAATVKFDEHLRVALATNVRAPLHLLRLARNMKNINVFMHVSTAYSNCHLGEIQERFFPCQASFGQLEAVLEELTDEQINQILPTILGPWPNTYTFTKAIAEKELRRNKGTLPLGIFRPAIIISTAREPLVCWLDNVYGPTGIAIGSLLGVLRTLQSDETVAAEMVPVDMVVNCFLVAAVNVHQTYKSSPPPEPPIFNYVSSVENRITWGEYMKRNIEAAYNTPFSNAVWYISLTLMKSAWTNQVYILFLHLLPGAMIDAVALCLGKKPKMLNMYRKIHKFSSVLSYFSTREIKFCNRNVRDLWKRTTDDDKQIFPFSMSEMSWEQYFRHYLIGIRRYILKESDDTLPQARITWKRLYYLHQLVKLIFVILAIYTLWSVLAALW